MRRLKEQYDKTNPQQGSVTTLEKDPNLVGIKKFCGAIAGFEGYNIVKHPSTSKEVWGKERKDKTGINYIYVDESGNVRVEKRNTQNEVLSNKIWQNCQDILAVTPAQQSIIDTILSTNKAYTKTFPGAGKLGTGREYTAVDVAMTPQGKESNLFVPGMHFLYKKTGSQNVSQDQISNIEKELNKAGYTLIEPTDEAFLTTGRALTDVLGIKYGELYKQQEQPIPTVWKTKLKTEEDKRKVCRKNIKNLYAVFKGDRPEKHGFITSGDRIKTKDIVYYCKQDKGFLSGIFGLQDELEELFRIGDAQGNMYGMRDYVPSGDNPMFAQ